METIDVRTFVNLNEVDPEPTKGWTLYYDETNNCRKFLIDPEKECFVNYENAIYNNFVLGGIAVPPEIELNIDELKRKLGLTNSREMKSDNLFRSGDFLYDIGGKRVRGYLKWMIESPLAIHYLCFDNLYDAVIEIVDESMMCKGGEVVFAYHRTMKEVLYRHIKKDLNGFLSILYEFGYPEIEKKNESEFCKTMAMYIEELSNNADFEDGFYLEIIRQNLKAVSRLDELGFMNFGNKWEIVGSYYQNYWNVILNTPDAMHIFDHETLIEKELKNVQLVDNGKPYELFTFKDSVECLYIQIADMLVGLLGRLFGWIDNTTDTDVIRALKNMNEQQKESFSMIKTLIDRSDDFCKYLIQSITANDIIQRRYAVIELISEAYNYGLINGPDGPV